jgi:hypothetical protein
MRMANGDGDRPPESKETLRANIRETADPFEISVQGGEAKAA